MELFHSEMWGQFIFIVHTWSISTALIAAVPISSMDAFWPNQKWTSHASAPSFVWRANWSLIFDVLLYPYIQNDVWVSIVEYSVMRRCDLFEFELLKSKIVSWQFVSSFQSLKISFFSSKAGAADVDKSPGVREKSERKEKKRARNEQPSLSLPQYISYLLHFIISWVKRRWYFLTMTISEITRKHGMQGNDGNLHWLSTRKVPLPCQHCRAWDREILPLLKPFWYRWWESDWMNITFGKKYSSEDALLRVGNIGQQGVRERVKWWMSEVEQST